MHGKVWVTIGLIAGFMLGSWTPLGQVVSRDTLEQSLFSLTQRYGSDLAGKTQAAAQVATLSRFRSLITAARKEPAGNILQNHGITLAAGFLDPEDAWAMHYSELARSDGLALASWSERASREQAGAKNSVTAAMPETDINAWYSQTNAAELGRLRATIAGIRAENTDIENNLASLDPQHPDHFMALCIHASNQGLIAFYTFLTTMGEKGVTRDDTANLSSALAAQLASASDHGRSGRDTAAEFADVLEALPAASAEEQRVRAKALEYYESFVLSFDLEDTLAAHLAAYPALIDAAIVSREPPYEVSGWVADFQELGRSRMELQAYRAQIAADLAGPTS